MRYLQVRNWSEFQHYQTGRHSENPTWIKVYIRLLHDPEFTILPDASKAHLMLIWLLVPSTKNRIPWDVEWLSRQLSLTDELDLELLIRTRFLEPVMDSVPECLDTCLANSSSLVCSDSVLEVEVQDQEQDPDHEAIPWWDRAPAQKSEVGVAARPLDSRSAVEALRAAVDERGRQSALMGCWLAVQFPNGVRPPPKLVTKQAKVAGQLALEYDSETLARMVFGMSHVFPYSEGESWDLFTLRDKASKALAASGTGGRVSATDRERLEYERGMEELARKYRVNGDSGRRLTR